MNKEEMTKNFAFGAKVISFFCEILDDFYLKVKETCFCTKFHFNFRKPFALYRLIIHFLFLGGSIFSSVPGARSEVPLVYPDQKIGRKMVLNLKNFSKCRE